MDIDFSPEKSLFSLPIVRWCAGASAAVALVVTLTIIYSLRALPFDLTAAGFNYFADLYKVPATLLAIGFTLVGLCAANHRSEQTKKQIERTAKQIELTNKQITLTTEQNVFSNHYKHLEEFEKYYNAIKERDNDEYNENKIRYSGDLFLTELYVNPPPHIDQKYLRLTYLEIYPNSKIGNFTICKEFLEELDQNIRSVAKKYNQVAKLASKKDAKEIKSYIITLSDAIEYFADTYLIENPYEDKEGNFRYLDNLIYIPQNDFTLITKKFINYITTIYLILSFDVSYKPSTVVRRMLSIQTHKMKRASIIDDLLEIDWDDQNIYRLITLNTNS